ncbi:MAG: nuclear transport factor 2 family protein [Acidobacteriales bacterium]|nr:nuclear transport factor 2 family protein [Terriglobales bacterium]
MKPGKRLSVGLFLLIQAVVLTAQDGPALQVQKLERAWLDAYEQRDEKAMNAIVADDFTITFPDGSRQTKPQIMSMLRTPPRPGQPTTKFYTEDVQARVYGDTVILVGRVSEWQRDGKPIRERQRYTDTYVKRDGRWQVVASHLSNDATSAESSKPAGSKD